MSVQVILTPEEFAEDLDLRLGRANGNVYRRKPGVEGVHDGQVMVRLKKKRFVILDYSIIPNDADIQVSQNTSHIMIPPGAGKTSCTNSDCNKVGVPVLLYDSDPTEPTSLYMRSGLCFTCQRNLNEKRRTQRKRPSDAGADGSVFGSTSIGKKYKIHPGAIVIYPVDGVGSSGNFTGIGAELQRVMGDISNDTYRLLHAVGSASEPPPPPPTDHDNHNDIAATAAAVAASVGADPGGDIPVVDDAATTAAMDAAASSAAATAAAAAVNDDKINNEVDDHEASVAAAAAGVPATSEDINALYDRAYESMNKGIFLLFNWKRSWDAAIAAAVATENVDDCLADAVASAAAVAAAASESQNDNMSSLLIAANGDEKKDEQKAEDSPMEVETDPTEAVVEAFEV